MRDNDLLRIIQKGESEISEFKENFDKETIETVVAFTNTKGGVILIGISDKGEIKGIHIGKETLKDWANRIFQSTEPSIIPEIEEGEINGKSIAIIQIKEFPIKPVSVRGRYFKRVKNSNRLMPMPEIAQMHFQSAGMSWDSLPVKDVAVEEIDLEKVKRYIRKANETGRRRIRYDEDPVSVLEKLGLIKEDKPTWAAILLFGRDQQSFLSKAVIHCGRFKEDTIVVDDRLIEGTLMEEIEEAMDFISTKTSMYGFL